MNKDNSSENGAYPKAFNIFELLRFLWLDKTTIILFSFAGLVASIGISLSLPNIYESKATLAPRGGDGSNALSRMANQYSGLAGLAGINVSGLGGGSISKAQLALEKAVSLSFFNTHIYEVMLPELMAFESWNQDTQTASYDSDRYNAKTKEWLGFGTQNNSAKPTAQMAFQKYRELLSIQQDGMTGLVTLRVKHQSPVVAKRIAQLVINKIGEDIRGSDIAEAQQSLEFLKSLISENTLIELDRVFSQLIEEQAKTIMLARVSTSYVFDIVDPPVVPETRAEPNRSFIVLTLTCFNFLLGVLLVVFRRLR
jgi:uncharacterized protein involved in exopolysaccharide biosynthesis